jgi:transcription factor C subunit 6
MQEELDESTPQRLGFLAGVWQDGCVRVLDIHLPSLDVSHLHIEEAAFEAKPPDTICTAVAWLSTSTIAVGCANGTIAVWNLATVCASPSTRRTNPRPWLHKRLHRTLILNIATGYPSRPSFVFTNSIDGTARQTDLRDPRADRAAAQRARVYQAPLAWCDGGQFAAAADDGHLVKALFLRYFHGSRMLSRADALVLDVAASPLHGALLAGAADGSVAAVNAVRRAMVYKSDAASRMTWFRYEWRGPVEGRGEEGGAADEILKKPLGRFVEGFKVISSVLSEEKLTKNGNPKFTVVYEENSAVNRVSWNTNLVSGTWAAAATVSGLIRIEDLALD